MTAAAFASCSALYSGRSFKSYSSPASLQNNSYASTLLQHAQQLYSFAVNARGGQMTYQTSVPIVQDSYPSSGYGDDLTLAALWLGLAQNDSTLITQAQNYYNQFQLGSQLPDSVFNWDSSLPGIPILGTQIYQSYPQLGGNSWQSQAEAYLDRIVSGKGAGKLTKGLDVRYLILLC
jgi:endoglucanase